MNPKTMLRIAAFFLLVFATGHTIGHLTRHDVADPTAVEVQRMMMDHKFDMFGTLRSYDENYEGMSLNLILTLLVFVVVLWILSGQTSSCPALVRKILIPVFVCILGFALTSIFYFFPGPATICFIAAACIGVAMKKLAQQEL